MSSRLICGIHELTHRLEARLRNPTGGQRLNWFHRLAAALILLKLITTETYAVELEAAVTITPYNLNAEHIACVVIPWTLYPNDTCQFSLSDGTVTGRLGRMQDNVVSFVDPTPEGSRVVAVRLELAATGSSYGPPETIKLHFRGGGANSTYQPVGSPQTVASTYDPLACPTSGITPILDTIWELRPADPATLNYGYRRSSATNCFLFSNADPNGPIASTEFAQIRIIVVYEPPPHVEFDLQPPLNTVATFNCDPSLPSRDCDRKILMNRVLPDDGYFSQHQERDGAIRIEGRLADHSGTSVPFTSVCFRSVDSPDTSPYIPVGGSIANRGGSGQIVGANTLGVLCTTTDGSGRFSFELETTRAFAGDNYEIHGSPSSSVISNLSTPCTPLNSCSKTPPVETWNRAYVELDRMFRKGSFFSANVASGSTRLPIYSMRGVRFAVQDSVLLIHSATNAQSGGPTGFYSEGPFTVTAVGKGYIDISSPTAKPFAGPTSAANYHTADAIGIIGGSASGTFEPDISLMSDLFEDAYVHHRLLDSQHNTIEFVPYIYRPDGAQLDFLMTSWNENRFTTNEFIVSAIEDDSAAHVGTSRFDHDYSVVLAGKIAGMTSNAAFKAEVTVHEVVHQWRPNNGFRPALNDHCDLKTWSSPVLFCEMKVLLVDQQNRPLPEFCDGAVAFHWGGVSQGGVVDSEYMVIRGQATMP